MYKRGYDKNEFNNNNQLIIIDFESHLQSLGKSHSMKEIVSIIFIFLIISYGINAQVITTNGVDTIKYVRQDTLYQLLVGSWIVFNNTTDTITVKSLHTDVKAISNGIKYLNMQAFDIFIGFSTSGGTTVGYTNVRNTVSVNRVLSPYQQDTVNVIATFLPYDSEGFILTLEGVSSFANKIN